MDFIFNDTCEELGSYSMNCTLDEVRNLSAYSDPNCSEALDSLMQARCSMGGVCQSSDGPNWERGGILAIVQVFSLIGNICTIAILSKFKVHKVPDVLVVGLALTDLLAALIPIPMSLYAYFTGTNFTEGCILCDFFGVFSMFTRCSSVQITSFVAVERYLAVNRPFFYRKHATPKRFIWVLIFGWALALMISVVPLIGNNTVITSHTGFCFFDITSYYALSIVFYSVIHFSTVLICFLLVTVELAKVYRRRKKLKVQDKYNSNSRARLREHSLSFTKPNFTSRISDLGKSIKKAAPIITEKLQWSVEAQFARMLFAVVALFYISWTTIVVVIIVAEIQQSDDNIQNAIFWSIRLSVISTAINPFLYGILARQYRMAYAYVLRLWLSKCCYCISPPLKDVFAAARTVGGNPHQVRRNSHPATHSAGSHSGYSAMYSSGNVKLTSTTQISVTLPPTLHNIQEELSLEPNESSITAEFSTHIPTAGELSSSVTIPHQARDHNDSSTVELQVRGAVSMHDLVDSGMVELGISRDHQDGIKNPLAVMTKIVGGQEVLISPGGSEGSENVGEEDTNPLFANPVYTLANGGTGIAGYTNRHHMLAASSSDDITLISKKKKKIKKARSNDMLYSAPSEEQKREVPQLKGGTLPLANGSPRGRKAHQSYVPLQSRETRYPVERSQKRYMRDRVMATDIDSGRTITVHSHENLTSLESNGTSPSLANGRGGGGGKERGSRASSFSPPPRPMSSPTPESMQIQLPLPPNSNPHSKVVSYIPIERNGVISKQQQQQQQQQKQQRHMMGNGEVWKLRERFESPILSSRAPIHHQSGSSKQNSRSLQSTAPLQGSEERGRRNSGENSDSGHESMVLEPDTATTN